MLWLKRFIFRSRTLHGGYRIPTRSMSRPRNSSRANILLSEQSFLTRRKPRKSTIMVVLLTTTQTLSTSRSAIVTVTLCHLSTRITEDSVWQLFHTDVDSRYRSVLFDLKRSSSQNAIIESRLGIDLIFSNCSRDLLLYQY